MEHLQKVMVALVAAVSMACSIVFAGAVWQLIRNPPEIQFTMIAEDRAQWEALGCTWELMTEDGKIECLSVRPWPLLRSLL